MEGLTFSSRAIEAAAAVIDPDAWNEAGQCNCIVCASERLSRREISAEKAEQALTAALAVDGVALAPVEPTAKMIAAAFPTEGERPPPDDMKIGAEAIMILEGGRDCGSITGPAVIEAASMCKDYRKMIAAASDREERRPPPKENP